MLRYLEYTLIAVVMALHLSCFWSLRNHPYRRLPAGFGPPLALLAAGVVVGGISTASLRSSPPPVQPASISAASASASSIIAVFFMAYSFPSKSAPPYAGRALVLVSG